MSTKWFMLCSLLILPGIIFGQDSAAFEKLAAIPGAQYSKINQKIISLEEKLDARSMKYLQKLAREENRIYKKIFAKDSMAAKAAFGDVNELYTALQTNAFEKLKRAGVSFNTYRSTLDSMTTAFQFLQVNKLANTSANLQQLSNLKDKLNQSGAISTFLQRRRKNLVRQLEQFGMAKEIKRLNKQFYYYQQQWKDLRQSLEDPSKFESRLLGLLSKIPIFSASIQRCQDYSGFPAQR